ncbi:hypothetical protein EDC94DRAFT_673560 [Helicostylum pulchrum]|nr:hypothetical protein EDC94DRAFT_673560 [Helicostylum pulchrum]
MTSQESSTTHAVLAKASIDSPSELNQRWNSNFKQRIIEFYGFEGEDFRYFRSLLESFFAIHGITQDQRRVIILKAQLRRAAAIFFTSDLKAKDLTIEKISYQDVIELLQNRFLTKDLLEEYEFAFQSMKQNESESPQMFLSRLYEAADLADIQEDKMIFNRFRAGLLPVIITFCKEQSASIHKDWVKASNAWWNAHADKPIHLVDNPFVSSGGYINVSLKSTINDNHKPQTEAYANAISPSIEHITAKLEALELHSLIPSRDSNGKIENTTQTTAIKSLLSDKEFKSFIKNIVQEVSNEKVTAYTPYNNRKPYNNDNNYNNDQNYQNNSSYQRNFRNRNFNSYANNDDQSRYNNQGQYNQPYNNNRSNYPARNNYNQDNSYQSNDNQKYNNQSNYVPPQNNNSGNDQRFNGNVNGPPKSNHQHGSNHNQKN